MPLQGDWNRDLVKGVAHYARRRPAWRLFIWGQVIEGFHPPENWQCHGAIARTIPSEEVVTPGTPLVFASRRDGVTSDRDVSPDDQAIGHLAAEHLQEIGFSRMTYYGGHQPWSVRREASFREATRALGARYLPCPVRYDRPGYDTDWSEGALRLGRWLETIPGPLGLMAANDGYARVASQACELAGLHVPEQVAIVGVDNDSLRCALAKVPLSSVDSAADRIGYFAAEVLDRWMSDGVAPVAPVLIRPRGLVRRQSTDVLAIADASIAEAVRFVRESAFRPIGVEEVAEAACLSRRLLERRFKRHVGRSVQQEITRVRVQRACEMLCSSDARLDQVANTSGFRSLAYFHTAFKRATGRTPMDYRSFIRGQGSLALSESPPPPA